MAYLWGQLIPMDGNTVECCGIEQCGNISEEKVYEDPAHDACCKNNAAYSFDYKGFVHNEKDSPCKKIPDYCNFSINTMKYDPMVSTSGPAYHCSGYCPEKKVCEDGVKTGYQQFAWENKAGWSSLQCPPDSVYKKQECQAYCGGTTGCRTICKNICEKITCSSDTEAVKNKNECTGTVTCSSSGCTCSNNPNWHP